MSGGTVSENGTLVLRPRTARTDPPVRSARRAEKMPFGLLRIVPSETQPEPDACCTVTVPRTPPGVLPQTKMPPVCL